MYVLCVLQPYSFQQKKHNDLVSLFLCVWVCPICKILIDLYCGRAIYIGAPESQSNAAQLKCKHFRRLIGILTAGPLPVKSEQCLLTWWDVCVCVCKFVCTYMIIFEWNPGLLKTLKKLWLKSETLCRSRLTMPSYNLNSPWFDNTGESEPWWMLLSRLYVGQTWQLISKS